MLPPAIAVAAEVYLNDPKTKYARERFLVALLQGMTTYAIPEAALVRGLEDMAVAGAAFTPVVVRTWSQRAQRLLEGEAGVRAAREALEAFRKPVEAPSAPSEIPAWAEDEL